ncbi:hypothetical protein RCL1_002175 [Eukaryota sp. TZLM3-RCL]
MTTIRTLHFDASGPLPEFIDIELQGSLETHLEVVDSTPIGDLNLTPEGTATLKIDRHLLHGKVVNLPNPRLLLSTSFCGSQLLVKGIIKKKITFNQRPQLVLNT